MPDDSVELGRGPVAARITMVELAQIAGVDVSTVSRALRGDERRVAAATMERIRALAAEHGFEADPLAAALRTGRSGVLGVLVPTMTDVAMARMLQGIAEEATERGYLAVITPTHSRPAQRTRAVNALISRRVDGVLLADSTLRSPLPGRLEESATPFLMALRGSGSHPGVVADDDLGGTLVAQHLLERGHSDFAVIAGPPEAATSVQRLRGFRRSLAQAGVELGSDRIVNTQWGVREGHAAMASLLQAGARPTAVFALNDYNAIGASRALQDTGLGVGTDVAVVGYNDVSISSELQVPLTSVHTDLERIGRSAVTTLLQMISGEDVVTHVVSPLLRIRASSGFDRATAP